MKNKISRFPALSLALVALLLTLNPQLSTAFAQGTAFTYQGRLNDGANPATGVYDLRFAIYDATNYPGTLIAGPITNAAAAVSNGLFTVALDFGGGVFSGNARWLEMAVRTNGAGNFTVLAPRQALLPAPYAIMANTASNLLGTLPATQLAGMPAATTNFSGALSGDVTGTQSATVVATVGGVAAANVASGASAANAATSAGTASTIVSRDAGGSFSATSLTLAGNLYLPATTASAGIIYSGGTPLVHTYGTGNLSAGVGAGNFTTTGTGNTGIGYQAIHTSGSGGQNVACGYQSLYFNSSGTRNVALGYQVMYQNTSGYDNVVLGYQALMGDGSSDHNVALGSQALFHANSGAHDNIAVGYMAGYNLASSAQNNINIGNQGAATQNNAIFIGTQGTQTTACIAGIYGITVSSPGAAVYVNSYGQLGTAASSRRFKTDIQDMSDASDGLLALRPVTFKYKPEIDPTGYPQFGLIAEEVEQVNPDLVIHDDAGRPYTVRYEAVNAMLLNEFLKEHKTVEAQTAELQAQGAEIQDLQQSVAELKALVEKLAGP